MELIWYVNEEGERMQDEAWKIEHLRVGGWKPEPKKAAPKKAAPTLDLADGNG